MLQRISDPCYYAQLQQKRFREPIEHKTTKSGDFVEQHDLEPEFKSMKWDITKLEEYKSGRESSKPFVSTLTELMQALIK